MAGLRLEGVRPRVLGPVELAIGAGELVLLSGPSGSGKSLLLRAVADLDPDDGEVWLDGVARSSLPAPEWRRRVGLLPAESHWWGEYVSDHFPWNGLSRSRASSDDGKQGSVAPPPRRSPSRGEGTGAPSSRTDLLEALGFGPEVLDWSVSRLSTGERQRLALARMLAVAPEALLLDEATANLDPTNRDRVEALVEDYRMQRSAAVLWVSHDPAQRLRLGGRRLVIREGRLEAEP
jgi:ABC-type iron transport system FetAB ATPase subunit